MIDRKNGLFASSQKGAKASANLYSIIEAAKDHGLNPELYLTQIYRQILNEQSVEDFEKFLPENFDTR
ncbi:MAG: transposase domain-containing protein [Alcanivoracaceae bacterium]|nr:transposase domain-containing protein [Alcanivoracaceae bacterium]